MLERLWISADKLIVLLLRRKEALHHEWDFHCIAVIQSKKTCLPYNFQYKPYKAACPDAPTVSLTTCRNCYERFWETVLYIGRIDTDRNNEQSNVVIKFRFSTKIWQTFQRKVSGWPLLFNPCLLISLNKGGFAKTLQNRTYFLSGKAVLWNVSSLAFTSLRFMIFSKIKKRLAGSFDL